MAVRRRRLREGRSGCSLIRSIDRHGGACLRSEHEEGDVDADAVFRARRQLDGGAHCVHEVGVPFESRPLSFPRRRHATPRSGDQPGRQGADLLIDGRPLTEVAGILFYLAPRSRGRPAADGDVEAEAQVVSWMSFIAATVHPARRQGAEHARRIYAIAEQRLGGASGRWRRYSIADIHLFRLYWRFRGWLDPAPGSSLR